MEGASELTTAPHPGFGTIYWLADFYGGGKPVTEFHRFVLDRSD